MAYRVEWSRDSSEDIAEIAEYIARDSRYYAASVVQELLDAGRSLQDFARRGRVVPEIGDPELREIIVRNYRVLYTVEESTVSILVIIHARRNLKRYLKTKKR